MAASASTTRWCSAFLSLLLFLSVCPSCQTHCQILPHSDSIGLSKESLGSDISSTVLPFTTHKVSIRKKIPHCLYAYLCLGLVKTLNSFCGFYSLFWTCVDLDERLWIYLKGPSRCMKQHLTYTRRFLVWDFLTTDLDQGSSVLSTKAGMRAGFHSSWAGATPGSTCLISSS